MARIKSLKRFGKIIAQGGYDRIGNHAFDLLAVEEDLIYY
jgi:hypothetical protein